MSENHQEIRSVVDSASRHEVHISGCPFAPDSNRIEQIDNGCTPRLRMETMCLSESGTPLKRFAIDSL